MIFDRLTLGLLLAFGSTVYFQNADAVDHLLRDLAGDGQQLAQLAQRGFGVGAASPDLGDLARGLGLGGMDERTLAGFTAMPDHVRTADSFSLAHAGDSWRDIGARASRAYVRMGERLSSSGVGAAFAATLDVPAGPEAAPGQTRRVVILPARPESGGAGGPQYRPLP